MRLSAVTETAQGFGCHDHLFWLFDEPGEWDSAVVEFLADGLVQGQRVCYATSEDAAQWSERLRDLDELATRRRKDATQVLHLGEMYPDEIVEPTRQLQVFAAAIEDALAAGFTGLRTAADDTPLVRTSEQRAAFARWEHQVDRYMVNQPFTGLCGYNRAELGHEAVAQVACLHPTVNGVPPPFRLHASTNDAAASLSGELDATSLHLFPTVLRSADLRPTDGELVIDASELTFIDQRSLFALAEHARHRDATVVLLSDHLPAAARMIDVFDLEDVRVQVPT
jgi:anti-anti-sigma regulatory factor